MSAADVVRRRGAVALLGALLAAVVFPLPGMGQDVPQASIDAVEVSAGHARFALTAANLPDGVALDQGKVGVDADGTEVPAKVTALDSTDPGSPAPVRVVVVLLDTSGSMEGSGIAAARDAAARFVADLPSDVHVGLVTFAEQSRLALPPTADRSQFGAALAAVGTGGNTALYDAVAAAISALDGAGFGPSAQRRLVVLSDGVDTSSSMDLETAARTLADAGAPTDVVAFRYGPSDTSAVQRIADVSGGRVLEAQDAAQLGAVFAAIARSFTHRMLVELDVPDSLAGRSVQLRVRVTTDAGVLEATAPVTFAALSKSGRAAGAGGGAVGDVAGTAPEWQLPALLGVIFVGVLLVIWLLVGGAERGEAGRRLAGQFERYGPRHSAERGAERGAGRGAGQDAAPQDGAVARTAVGLVDRMLGSGPRAQVVAARLDLAGMKIKAAEWTLLRICTAVVLAAALTVLFGSALLGIPIGVFLGWLGTKMYLGFRTRRRLNAFGEQLPDVLQLVAGSLQSGFSLPQALDAVVRENTQPSAAEFYRALAETRIGFTLEDALDRVAYRMNSADLRWIVMAVRIQREVGGNLAEVLLNTVETMRDRAKTRRQVRALSAEGRLSAYILVALPIVVATWLFLVRRDYMRPIYTTPIGIVMLLGAGLLVGVGALWMRKLVKVEV